MLLINFKLIAFNLQRSCFLSMGKIVLITGGARSGKSKFAENYVAGTGKDIAYIATSQIFDDEMAYRVKLHRQRRPANWQTFEAPFNAHEAINEAFKQHDTILFDCLTLYLSNYLCQEEAQSLSLDDLSDNVSMLMKELISAVRSVTNKTCVFVTNEVGAGIVPENELARKYRDLAGLCNQQIAKTADEVYLVVSGIPLQIK